MGPTVTMTDSTTTIRIADLPLQPPSAARLHPSRPQLYRRQSRFTEEMTEDHTPAPSMYEHEETSRSIVHPPSPPHSPLTSTTPRDPNSLEHIIRGMNACAHGAACVILIAIVVEFLTQSRGHWYGRTSAQAIALLVFLGLDISLDVISLIRLHTPSPTWALLLRVLIGAAYIILFLAYVAHDYVFPPGFTFWAMKPGSVSPLVYGFLWLLGVWAMAHAAIRRHRFGNGLRSYYRGLRNRPQPPHLLFSTPARPSRRTPAWRKLTGAQPRRGCGEDIEGFTPRFGGGRVRVPAAGGSLPLRDRQRHAHARVQTEKPGRRSFTATVRTASSHTVCEKSEERGLVRHDEKEEEEGGSYHSVPPAAAVKM